MEKKRVVNLFISVIFIILMLIFVSCSKTTNVEVTNVDNESKLRSEEEKEISSQKDYITDNKNSESVSSETESSTDKETGIMAPSETSSDLSVDTTNESQSNIELSLEGKWESEDRPPEILQISEISEDVLRIELQVYRYFTIHAEAYKTDTGFEFEDEGMGIKGTITSDGKSIIVSVYDLGSFSSDGYLAWHLANIEFNQAE